MAGRLLSYLYGDQRNLFQLIERRDFERALLRVQSHPEEARSNAQFMSCLHLAASMKTMPENLLIEIYHAFPPARDQYFVGFTPVLIAMMKGNLEQSRILIELGSDVSRSENSQALHYGNAWDIARRNKPILNLLLSYVHLPLLCSLSKWDKEIHWSSSKRREVHVPAEIKIKVWREPLAKTLLDLYAINGKDHSLIREVLSYL